MLTKSHSMPPLRGRILRAGSWMFGGYGASQVIRLASNLVMTRLLMPEAFGTMAIATSVMVAISMFSDLGLRQAIVQNKRGHEPIFLNTVWVGQIIRGFVISSFTVLAGLAIWIINSRGWIDTSSVYASPELPMLVSAIGVISIFSGFESTKIATASRALALHNLTIIEIISQVLGVAAMIGFALFRATIWSLVLGNLVSVVAKVVLSHAAMPGERNRFEWDGQCWDQVRHFGKWIFLNSILGFLSKNLDRLLVAGFLTIQGFAMFTIATILLSAPRNLLDQVFAKVCYPAFSEVARERPQAIARTYYQFCIPIDLFCLFTCGFLFFGGPTIVRLLYDPRYQEAGGILAIVSLSLFAVRYGVAGACYMAVNKPKYVTLITFVRTVSICGLVPLGYWAWGANGVVLAVPSTFLLTLPIVVYLNFRLNLWDKWKELAVLPALAAGALFGWALNWGYVAVFG